MDEVHKRLNYRNELSFRYGILFHSLNFVHETEGCIGIGEKIGYIGQERAILDSKSAMALFMDELKEVEEFKLRIK